MRGFADPYTLGFIVLTLLATNDAVTKKQPQLNPQMQNQAYIQQSGSGSTQVQPSVSRTTTNDAAAKR
ncbi:MAG: hypothetical protein R3E95_01480 [Thiolinea sp.]